MQPAAQARLAMARVTDREAEILLLVGSRLTNREIAGRLCISVRTVESHVSALLRKLAVAQRPALVELARELAAEPAVPVPPTSFVGREEELAQLRGFLAAGRLVCLTGPPGCGKSRLALEAARVWAGEVAVAGLAAVAEADVGAVIAAALGIGNKAADLAVAARVALAGRNLLLVADDCDHVVAAAAEILSALTGTVPGLRVVVSCRQALGASGEQLMTVSPLPCPAGQDPAAVRQSAAGRLFSDRAKAASPQFCLDQATAPHVADICRRLDGLPLAIELAATRVRTLDLAALAETLTSRPQLMERTAGPGRHRSLAAAIEWSWELLDQAERDVLGRLAALPGEFTLAMAQAVAPVSASADLAGCLGRLADRSLISVTVVGGQPARYRLLNSIRAFAAERAAVAGPATGRAGRPAQLPSAVGGFTGRQREFADLDARMASTSGVGSWPAVVISAVSGTAGIGKTALAVQWAHHVADRFPDGQLFANLRGFDPDRPPAEPGAVLRGFLEALGAAAARIPDDPDAQAGLFRSMLADRRVLVVLDNARDSDQVRPLLPGAPGCLAVVTSRNRLASLAALEGAHLLPLDLLTRSEARELLARRLGQDRVEADDFAVDEIIAACAGLPLALAIVAGRAASRPNLPLAAVAAELREAASPLDAIRGEDALTDLRAVFSWSVGALSPAAARLFRLLGLHPGPDVTAPAAASLAAQPPERCAAVLAELVSAHLLGEPVPGRYALHDLLRTYAAELVGLDTEVDRSEARRRMFDHYLQTAHAGALQTGPLMESITLPEPGRGVVPEPLPDENQAMTWFSAEHAVLMAMVEEAAARGFAGHAWRLAWCIDTPLHRASRWRDEVRVHTVGTEAARAVGESAAAATVTLLLGRGLSELRQWDAAERAVLEALRLYRARGDARLEAHGLIYLGLVAFQRGQLDQGVAITGQAVRLCRQIGEHLGLGTALANLAGAHYELGEYQHARDLCNQALEVHGQTGNRECAIGCWIILGDIERDSGHTTRALRCYGTATRLSREVGHSLWVANALTSLGDLQDSLGHRPAAERSWREALAILTDLDHPDAEGMLRRLSRT